MRKKSQKLRFTIISAIFAALISVSSMIYIPAAVPITMQTLVIFAGFFIVGGKLTSTSVLIYIMIGALGVPVFSGFGGGISRLFDATGGYIFGMLIGALVYWLLESILPKSDIFRVTCAAVSLLVIYTVGTAWYAFVYANGVSGVGAVLLTTVVPFIIPDIIKLAVAFLIAKRIPRLT